ncbi:MAG: hypothetical protein AB7N71_00820 [Phycisphaerae bacterium]
MSRGDDELRDRSTFGRSRIVFGVVFLALVSLFAMILYLSANTAREAFRIRRATGDMEVSSKPLTSILLVGVLATIVIVFFLCGAYLLMRVGRMVTREKVGGSETELPDSWRASRVSEDEYQRVDEQLMELQREWEDEDRDDQERDHE